MSEIVKCPVCDGQGHLNKPPWIAGDQQSWMSTSTATHQCRRCDGVGTLTIHPEVSE